MTESIGMMSVIGTSMGVTESQHVGAGAGSQLTTGAESQHTGSGSQQTGSGSQQTGSGSQADSQLGSTEQHWAA